MPHHPLFQSRRLVYCPMVFQPIMFCTTMQSHMKCKPQLKYSCTFTCTMRHLFTTSWSIPAVRLFKYRFNIHPYTYIFTYNLFTADAKNLTKRLGMLWMKLWHQTRLTYAFVPLSRYYHISISIGLSWPRNDEHSKLPSSYLDTTTSSSVPFIYLLSKTYKVLPIINFAAECGMRSFSHQSILVILGDPILQGLGLLV